MYKILLQGENNDRQILLEGLINYSSACVVAFSQTHTHKWGCRVYAQTHLWSRINSIPDEIS